MIKGCFYYKVTQPEDPSGPALIKSQQEEKYIIIHHGTEVWHLKEIIAGQDSITAKICALKGHRKYLTTNPEGLNRYSRKDTVKYDTIRSDEYEVINEVHVYTSALTYYSDSAVSIPLNAIEKIEIYDPARGATIASWVFTGLAIGAAVVAVVVIVVLLTKESCPFIYVTDGSSTAFVGEIYSGAIYPSLERYDYLPLPPPEKDQHQYTLKMTNEVHEIQHTNLIELEVFDHPAGTKVLVDKYGKCRTMSDLKFPSQATNLNGKNILGFIREEDTLRYCGDIPGKDPVFTDGIILEFDRPQGTDTAKLVVKAKNTFWLDYVFTRFHALFGKEYDCWVEKQETVPDKKMKNWTLEQQIPMSLFIEKNGKWKFVDYYNLVGPMAAKEDVLAIDLSDIKEKKLRIKLEYGFQFWEVDYAAADFTADLPVKRSVATFESAVDQKGKNVKNLLSSADTLYYVQPEIGDWVDMTFTLPEPSDARQTLILHSRGYYKILLNLTGEQQKEYLLSFMKKGRFPEFSYELYKMQYSKIAN